MNIDGGVLGFCALMSTFQRNVLPLPSGLKVEAMCSSETLAYIQNTTGKTIQKTTIYISNK
jgi:hypothetical protein